MSDNVTPFPGYPRAVKPVPQPLGLFVRTGRNDHSLLLNMLASGDAAYFGAVLDPTRIERHGELRDVLIEKRLDAILDPMTQQLALPGSFSEKLGDLPWAKTDCPQRLNAFDNQGSERIAGELSEFVAEHKFTQVLAPTHLLGSASDPWLAADARTTLALRKRLDSDGLNQVPIIYSLAITAKMLRDGSHRQSLIKHLQALPISEVWLKIDRFGSQASPTGTLAYIEAAKDFASLGIPVVADHVGGVIGLALLAFGSAGGIAHGITLGERFDSTSWRKPSTGTPFAPARRIYIPTLDLLLKPADARMVIEASTRSKALFGCSDGHCCPRGIKDQLENPGRHFIVQRMKEMGGLSQIPEQLRPQRFLDGHLRPATDKALAAATINWNDNAMAKRMQENRKRLDALRVALGNYADIAPVTHAVFPMTRAAREARR